MFRIQPNPTFKSEVTIPTPEGAGKIKFEFKHKGRKALQEFLKMFSNDDPEKDVTEGDILADIVAGWDGVDTEFSSEALADLIDNYPSAGRAIIDAYVPALLEGKQKN